MGKRKLKKRVFNLVTLLITGAFFSLNGGCAATTPQTRRVPYSEPVAIVHRNFDTGAVTTNTVYIDGFVEEEIPELQPEPITAEDILLDILTVVGPLLDGQSGTL